MANIKKIWNKKQQISFWKHHEIKAVIKRRSKLTDEDIQYMIKLAENKTTSDMSSRKIILLMNKRNLKIRHMIT